MLYIVGVFGRVDFRETKERQRHTHVDAAVHRITHLIALAGTVGTAVVVGERPAVVMAEFYDNPLQMYA